MDNWTARRREQARAVERSGGVVIRRLLDAGGLDLTEYTVPRGFTTGPSDHDTSDKVGYVVSGAVEIRTPDATELLTAGSAYHLPRGVPHQFVVVEDAMIVQVRTPPAG